MAESFTVRTRIRLKVRSGRPSLTAPTLPTLEPGIALEAIGTVTGDSYQGENRWYALSGDRYVWAGGCDLADSEPLDPDAERPDRSRLGDQVPPLFETVPGVSHRAQGRRPNGLEGLIVHFDAYRIRAAGNGAENSDVRTVQMIGEGKRNNYHDVEISRTGKVFVPDGFDWNEWGSHAGTSLCPLTRRTGVSQYYVGVEMNNPGLLYPTADPNVLVPWHNSRRTAQGVVILDGQGRATRTSASDEWYTPVEARLCPARGNIKSGWYLPYSHDQFEALTLLVLYLARRFSTFSLTKVFGHDEVAPSRKNDPGGALGNPDELMTMEEFRAYLSTRC
jgi:hypothetical protein